MRALTYLINVMTSQKRTILMSQTLPPEIRSELDQLKEEVESIKTLLAKASTSPLPNWLSTIFQGVTLTIVIGAAFWFGSLGSAVARTEVAVVELTTSVQDLKESRVEVNARLRAIEVDMNSRFNAIESKLNTVESRLTTVESRLTTVESRLTSIEKKLERRP